MKKNVVNGLTDTRNSIRVNGLIEADKNEPLRDDYYHLMELFLASIDLKKSSIDVYKRQLRGFVKWASQNKVTTPSRDDILKYKEYLYQNDLSALTISSYIVVVRKFFAWMESSKIYPNIARDIKGMKRSRGFRKDTLTIDQIGSILCGIEFTKSEDLRDYALINLLIRTGLRTIEVARSNLSDIRQKGGESVLWIQGKGRDTKDEFVVLTKGTKEPIEKYLSSRPKNTKRDRSPIFISHSSRNFGSKLTTRSVSRIVKKRLVAVGIDNSRLTAHSLRHTAITLALKGGATIQEAQALGRHANINTTMIYAHNISRIENAPENKIDKLLETLKL